MYCFLIFIHYYCWWPFTINCLVNYLGCIAILFFKYALLCFTDLVIMLLDSSPTSYCSWMLDCGTNSEATLLNTKQQKLAVFVGYVSGRFILCTRQSVHSLIQSQSDSAIPCTECTQHSFTFMTSSFFKNLVFLVRNKWPIVCSFVNGFRETSIIIS